MKALPHSFEPSISRKVAKNAARRVAKLPASKKISKTRTTNSKAASAYWHSFDDRVSEEDYANSQDKDEESGDGSESESSKVSEVVGKKAAAKKGGQVKKPKKVKKLY